MGAEGKRYAAGTLVAASALAVLVALTAPHPAAAERRPNVLVIVTDDQPAAGTMQVMPRTRAVFRRGGRRFPNAVATTPNCCPSRASILSGRYAHNHGVLQNRDNAEQLAALDPAALLPHLLRSRGYRTGIVGKYLNGWPNSEAPPGFDRFAISPGAFFNTPWNLDGTERVVSRYSTDFIRGRARRLIGDWERRDRKPWFLYVAPFAPHGTLGPGGVTLEPAPRHEAVPVGGLPPNPARAETDPAALADKPPFWRQLVAGYRPGPGAPSAEETRAGQLRMLLSVDEMVAGIFRKLRRAREGRATLAIFLSDNGLFWGEHGAPPVKDMPYRESVRIPMFMRWPGRVGAGGSDGRLAANIDLAPTILDAARAPIPPGMDGRSLLRRWQRPHILLEYWRSGPFPTWASLYSPGREQYTEYYVGDSPNVAFREYYDLGADPWQLENLLGNGDPGDDPDVAPLASALAAARACAGASCP